MRNERIRFETPLYPKIIVLDGLSGSGKTTQGFRLEKLFKDRSVRLPNPLGKRAIEKFCPECGHKREDLKVMNQYLAELREFTENTEYEFVLCEGGYSSLISHALTKGAPLPLLKRHYQDLNSKMMDLKRDFGYLEFYMRFTI